MRSRNRSSHEGFTLVELLLVISLLGVISMIAVPRFTSSDRNAKICVDETNVAFIDLQWETKRITDGDYGSLSALLSDTDLFPGGPPACPFGTTYTDTDGDHRVDAHTH